MKLVQGSSTPEVKYVNPVNYFISNKTTTTKTERNTKVRGEEYPGGENVEETHMSSY